MVVREGASVAESPGARRLVQHIRDLRRPGRRARHHRPVPAGKGGAARLADARQPGVFLALVGAPIAYGGLVVQHSAPEIWIEPLAGDAGAKMRLLSRSDGGVLVWLEDERKVRWINVSRIDVLTVGPDRPILTISCSETGAAPEGE